MALKKELSPKEILLTGVGIILGAGIYSIIGKAAGIAGNALWISFVLGMFLAILTGLSYAELASMFPKAGAEFVFVQNAFGNLWAFMVGISIILMGIFASAAVGIAFAGYFEGLTGINATLVFIGLVLFITAIQLIGVREAVDFGVLGTLIEAGGLVLIFLISLPFLGSVDYLLSPNGVVGVVSAAALSFFAYIGFGQITRFSEEVSNPEKVIPNAVMYSIAISALLYILVAISVVSVLGYDALAASKSPLADVARVAAGNWLFGVLSIIALFSTFNTVLLVAMSTVRMIYGMATENALPRWLSKTDSKGVPVIATLLVGLIILLSGIAGDLRIVAEITDFSIFFIYVLVNLSLIKLRREGKHGKFSVPFSLYGVPLPAVLGALICILFTFSMSTEAIIVGATPLILSFILYKFYNPKISSQTI